LGWRGELAVYQSLVRNTVSVRLTPNSTETVNPSQASIDALAERPDDDAIIMFNVLRYQPDGGQEAYARYGAVAYGTVRARGGSAPYTGAVVEQHSEWDRVILVRYPRRAAYLDMQTDPAYVGAIPDRTTGLSARLLYAFHDANGGEDDSFQFDQTGGNELFVVDLLRYTDPATMSDWEPNGDVVLRLQGDHAMVSDDVWHELIVTRHASNQSLEADLSQHPAIEASIRLVTNSA
jgi:hypothetical protein